MRGSVLLILLAGIDTTWSAIGSALWHLATHPDDRRRLVAEPELMPTAIEELLRAYAPVTMARIAAKDHELGGCPVKEGDWVLLPFPAANRDPEVFDQADEVISTGPATGTRPSGSASTAAWAPTWPASSCGWRWRNGWPRCRSSPWPRGCRALVDRSDPGSAGPAAGHRELSR